MIYTDDVLQLKKVYIEYELNYKLEKNIKMNKRKSKTKQPM